MKFLFSYISFKRVSANGVDFQGRCNHPLTGHPGCCKVMQSMNIWFDKNRLKHKRRNKCDTGGMNHENNSMVSAPFWRFASTQSKASHQGGIVALKRGGNPE